MRSWIVVHIPSRSLLRIMTKSLKRVFSICGSRGWKTKDLMIRVK
ncbi:MAG TPA: hypothetical protein VGB25_09800 [Candidatus Binatia bacterium]